MRVPTINVTAMDLALTLRTGVTAGYQPRAE